MDSNKLYTFTDDDIFEREVIAKNLTSMLEEQSIPISISIDSYWGSGKTTFLKKWMNELNNSGTKTLYLDAWAFDYNQDPIIPIIGTLESVLKLDEAKKTDFINAIKTIVFELVKSNFSFLDLEKISQNFDTVERLNLYQFRNLEREKQIIRDALLEYSNGKKVYFFIDELDRCKPIFSIKLLERIKHFLDVENFIFVFAVDLEQLGMSVKSIYGGINTESYFRKFFDFNFHLPLPEVNKYFQFLFISNSMDDLLNKDYVYYTSRLIERKSEIGLRECEKIFNIIRVCNNMIAKYGSNCNIFPILIVFKIVDPDNYKRLLNNNFLFDKEYLKDYHINYVYDNKEEYIESLLEVLSYKTLGERQKILEGKDTKISNKTMDYSLCEYVKNTLEFANMF